MSYRKTAIMLAVLAAAVTGFSRAVLPDVPPTIAPDWRVDLRTVCAVGGVVLPAAWFIGRWMKKIELRLDQGEKWQVSVDVRMNHRDERLESIESTLAKLPCQEEECPPKRKRP